MAVYHVGINISCRSYESSEHCGLVSDVAVLIMVEILVNLALFQYYSRHNCVTHWQRQSCVAGLFRSTISSDELTLAAEEEGEFDPAYLCRFCTVCNREAPIRSHHCPICKICVLRKDHHCFITGACVGLGNQVCACGVRISNLSIPFQRYFIIFLFWACVGLLLGARYTVAYLYETSTAGFPFGFLYCVGPIAVIRWMMGYSNFLHAFVCTIFSFILASLIAAGGFFGMQVKISLKYVYVIRNTVPFSRYTILVMATLCMNITAASVMLLMATGELSLIIPKTPGFSYSKSFRTNLGERFRLIFGRHWILNFFFPQFWNAQILTSQIATNLFRVRSKQL
ncbi:unnamed protein product [Strongylus vulgaris]|uniref:Palmitoyltransferase n=1 Tax=Strongylus vulgaris TaxID=40348 RepID=A0A3P7JHC7_STRVU|nr:unnamed protein product [Strongylus vulgaris]